MDQDVGQLKAGRIQAPYRVVEGECQRAERIVAGGRALCGQDLRHVLPCEAMYGWIVEQLYGRVEINEFIT